MSCSKLRKVETENRQFKAEWTEQFCFTIVGLSKPMCLICNEVISVVKVCNLKRHYESKHKEFHSKFPPGSSLRQRKISSLQFSHTQGTSMIRGGSSAQDKCTEASFRVSWILCKNMIPFTHAEVVKECMLESVKVMEGEESVNKYKKIPLSNDTATRRCKELANNISCQLVSELSQCNYFSLAADESTDISDTAQLTVFVRFFNGERFMEELLGLVSLHGRTTGEIIFNEISKLLATKNVSIDNIVSVVTDGAPAMISEKEGLVGRMKQINSSIIPYHCIIHNTVLCAKLSKDFVPLLTEITKLVNFLRSKSALTHRNLKKILNDLDSEFTDVLLYNNVRWLSKGQLLKRVWDLRKEIALFLEVMDTSGKRDHFLNILQDPYQLARLAFLVDIFSYLNHLNLSLQGKYKTVCELSESV